MSQVGLQKHVFFFFLPGKIKMHIIVFVFFENVDLVVGFLSIFYTLLYVCSLGLEL